MSCLSRTLGVLIEPNRHFLLLSDGGLYRENDESWEFANPARSENILIARKIFQIIFTVLVCPEQPDRQGHPNARLQY